jgi:hypothetical protein
MPATYEPIATTTLGSTSATITFSTIPATYTDLRVVLNAIADTSAIGYDLRFRINGDTATNYSGTDLSGNGSAASSNRTSNQVYMTATQNTGLATTPSLFTFDYFSYAGSTNKTVLSTASSDRNGSGETLRKVSLWRSTSAITSVSFFPQTGSFAAGTTATLYGILKA